eukprot:135125-Amphidinium_carterae.1
MHTIASANQMFKWRQMNQYFFTAYQAVSSCVGGGRSRDCTRRSPAVSWKARCPVLVPGIP